MIDDNTTYTHSRSDNTRRPCEAMRPCQTLKLVKIRHPFRAAGLFVAAFAMSTILLVHHCGSPLDSSTMPAEGGVKNNSLVLTFSLYGDSARYTDGALANARLYKWIYPSWKMRVYHDDAVPVKILDELASFSVELINMSSSTLNPMNWRFMAASDRTTHAFCSRDIDSRLTVREQSAVSEWLLSDHSVHMIRDHPGHIHHPLMGGMWCAKHNAVPQMQKLIYGYSRAAHFNADQEFLRDVVWPLVKDNILQHGTFGCEIWPELKPIPAPRVGLEHVGAVYIDHMLREEDSRILEKAIKHGEECPQS